MTNVGKRLAAVLFVMAMVMTLMLVLGTQTAFAEDYVSFSTKDGLYYEQDGTSDGYAPEGYDGGLYVASYDGKAASITIPSEVKYNGKTYCVTMIGNGGLSYFDEHAPETLIRVILPDTIRSIRAEAFWGTNITYIDFPEGLEWIGDKAFKKSKLEGFLIIPAGVKGIGNEAFLDCNLDDIYCRTPEGATQTIGSSAFGYYTKEDESYERYNCTFHIYQKSPLYYYADLRGFTDLDYFKEAETFRDFGKFELDLSKAPLMVSPEEDPTRATLLALFLFAYGRENRESFLSEGNSPDRMCIDADKDGTWDLEILLYKNGEGKYEYKYHRAETCSVEGTVILPILNPKNRAIELGYTGCHSSMALTLSKVNVSLSPASFTYDGTKKTPSVKVTASTEGVDRVVDKANYTVEYPKGMVAAGTYHVKVTVAGGETFDKTFVINKAANPLSMKPKTATIKYSKLKKKAQTLAVSKVIKFTKDAKDKKTYTLSSAKKGKKSFKKYFKIDKSTGKVTVKKGLKKGTYKVKVKVKAQGNANYKASAAKTVTFTVKVK